MCGGAACNRVPAPRLPRRARGFIARITRRRRDTTLLSAALLPAFQRLTSKKKRVFYSGQGSEAICEEVEDEEDWTSGLFYKRVSSEH